MIGSLRGTLLDRTVKGPVVAEAIIDVNGVGYRVTLAAPSLGQLGELGSTVFVHVHTHVREDALVLYAFATRDERVCFEVLLGAHGVGPALALAILSAHSPTSLRTAVATDDAAALTSVAGVGSKTAARLLIELKSRFEGADFDADRIAVDPSRLGGKAATATKPDPRADVREALTGLGYGAEEIRAAIRLLGGEGDSAALLKQALGILAGAPR